MLELVSRQLLQQCADLRQAINETRAALEPMPPEPEAHTKLTPEQDAQLDRLGAELQQHWIIHMPLVPHTRNP